MDQMIPFGIRKNRNVRKIFNRISVITVIKSISVFRQVLKLGMALSMKIWDLI